MPEVKIKKIEIKIDKKTISLSVEQARALKAALSDLFPYIPAHYEYTYTTGGTLPNENMTLNIKAT